MAQNSAAQSIMPPGSRGRGSGETLRSSNSRSDRLNRRQRREQLKQHHRQTAARPSTETQKPQSARRRPAPPKAAKGQAVNQASRISAYETVKPVRLSVPDSRTQPQNAAATSPQIASKTTPRRQRLRPTSPLVYGARLLILGVGIGAIAGTLLSVWDPSKRLPAGASATPPITQVKPHQPLEKPPAPLPLGQEIVDLKSQVQALVTKNPKFQAGVFFVDLDTGAYLNWDGDSTFASASTIKFPILVAFFQDVDAGKIRLDEKLTIEPQMIGEGSGDLQFKKPGTQLTALETVNKMITISDNTATNMLIARLGGAEALNQRFHSWGLTTTTIHNALPDLEGTNTTSPKELASLMAMVNQGDLVSLQSRDRMLEIMRRTVTNTLLPRGLGKGATIAHKTGDIGSLVADVGLIDMPIGKRYIAAVMVKRPHNDPGAQELIRQISEVTYKHFSQPAAVSSVPTSSPAPQPPKTASFTTTSH